MPDVPQVRILAPKLMSKELSRRLFLGGSVAAGATLALAACAPGSTTGGRGTGSLNLYTWGTYDDPEVLTDFTSETGGPTVALDSYGSNEEMIAKLATAKGTSGYDLVVPTLGYVPQMIELDLLEKLDHSKLPNMKNLDSNYTGTKFDENNDYSIPKAWGSAGYAYDTTVVTTPMTTWDDFWRVAQNEASGSFSLLDDPNEIFWAYAFWKGIDPATNDEADLAGFQDFIVNTMATHIQAFESYPSGTITQNGRILAHAWNGDARQGIIENPDQSRYVYVQPTEGGALFQDNWSIVKGSANVDAAHDFINYVLDPAVSLKECIFIGYNTCVTGIEEAATEGGDFEFPEYVFFTEDQIKGLVFDEVVESQEERVSIYNELKASAGQ
ncbi:polyamine ABC transporter substrate-binding protein [Naasia lichenicola]|uniref:Spermidine/putrescine ABC transporter substrate-binding protein n=1 Tax=Naasia lichenicola TaxID=2565933 RepID=A0A4S4FR84_9MICO|nr:spermidine/putrescine ABC transporter substrate-binding protein [Naasia lichenicola]THG33119.1 spermidine/putrescine ABC transporter substrate-binding protein [Naasia lichenicola]